MGIVTDLTLLLTATAFGARKRLAGRRLHVIVIGRLIMRQLTRAYCLNQDSIGNLTQQKHTIGTYIRKLVMHKSNINLNIASKDLDMNGKNAAVDTEVIRRIKL